MSRRIELALLLVAIFFLGSCTRKAIPTKTAATTDKTIPAEIRATNVDFRYLMAKGKAQIEANGEKLPQVNLTLRMRKDSVIWLSLSVGLEVARVYITHDTVQIINRLQKEYYSGNPKSLSQKFNAPITFELVQAVLLGNYLPPGPGVTPTTTTEGGSQHIEYQQVNLLISQLLDLGRMRVQQLSVVDQQSQNKGTVDYSDFRPLNATPKQFAYSMLVKAQQTKGPASTVVINYRNVDVDKERLAFPFSVPSGYARKK